MCHAAVGCVRLHRITNTSITTVHASDRATNHTQVLTLVILGAERVLIAGLLAAEEVILELLVKGGVLAGVVGAVAVAAYVAWSFAGKRAQ
jgi:hypothetical protein